ncbi:MAG: class I SAM-dependent methyltransferase [Alphaproteobacteria bacterium]|nr:class I SAM-dependent methyltransferase [Alphaproteobacteria bacterium]
MTAEHSAEFLTPGSAAYEAHLREEIEHYGQIYESEAARETLMQPVPTAWNWVEARAAEAVRQATGNDVLGHLIDALRRRPGLRLLSLGSGPGGIEIEAIRNAPAASGLCLDINTELLHLGQERAATLGLQLLFEAADLNTLALPAAAFDVVLCHASLHHVIELEHLAAQISRALTADGVFLTVDVVTRNGYLMWPETRQVVANIWKMLPARYRLNHTAYRAPLIDDEIWEADTSASGMECARSEDILPIIDERFVAVQYVPYFSLCRRFFDTMYGPNYDLASPLDKAIVNWVWELDRYHLATGRLRPETFFGIYRPRR